MLCILFLSYFATVYRGEGESNAVLFIFFIRLLAVKQQLLIILVVLKVGVLLVSKTFSK